MKTITILKRYFHWTQTDTILHIVKNVKKFSVPTEKKNNSFLQHYQQTGGSLNNRLIRISIKDPITYFSITFSLHSNFYNFFDTEKTVHNFVEVVR